MNRTGKLTASAMFVGLMTVGANISVWLPFLAVPIGGQTVPLSMQPFFALLAGLLLGYKWGSYSMICYILLGLTGLPIFADLSGGFAAFAGPTGGFLLSFIFIAFIAGFIMEKTHFRFRIFGAVIAGVLVNYLIGVTYMYTSMQLWMGVDISYLAAWVSMVPFFLKDFCFAILAALFYPRVAHAFGKGKVTYNTSFK
ncbi:biotin transport system substrate-specific component [Terribacillus halophilus]|uniref:Biotin transporter n=1 Tax=Terribacillus halophilus TaxID=361279 RepID=A0A1G6JMD3_9BACI|nr:biotin transporter BioY [Terribacillus halophilus]SDC19922.1 biotin transport system substrate-specific component [Terribacillus halophilus]